MTDPVEAARDGAIVRVRAKPRSSRDAIAGVDERGVRVEVRAAPEDGKANAAVIKVLARALGVPQAALSVASGAGARNKRIAVRGLTPAEVRARLGSSGA